MQVFPLASILSIIYSKTALGIWMFLKPRSNVATSELLEPTVSLPINRELKAKDQEATLKADHYIRLVPFLDVLATL